MTSQNSALPNPIDPTVPAGKYNSTLFAIQQALSKMQTATLVKIVACTNSDDLLPVGLVDVLPMVNQVDALGNPTPHVTIYNIPYFRVQGGSDAIIIDPKRGDIGICVFASQDISKIKSTKDSANPGSHRQYSYSDGIYLGGILNGVPMQCIQFSEAGIKIHSPNAVILDAPDVKITAPTVEINATTSVRVVTPIFTYNGHLITTGITA